MPGFAPSMHIIFVRTQDVLAGCNLTTYTREYEDSFLLPADPTSKALYFVD